MHANVRNPIGAVTILSALLFFSVSAIDVAQEQTRSSPESLTVQESHLEQAVSDVEADQVSLPSTRAEFLRLSVDERRQVLSQLEPQIICDMWYEKFDNVTALPEWSDEQLTLLIQAYDVITPQLYTVAVHEGGVAAFEQIAPWIRNLARTVSMDQLAALVLTLEDYETALPAVWQTLDAIIDTQPEGDITCDCNQNDDWCGFWRGPGWICPSVEFECLVAPLGCGSFLIFPCNGFCIYIF